MEDFSRLLSDSRMRIIQLLKRQGMATVEETAEALDLAKTTIRQHLDQLEEQELIANKSVASGRGRPSLHYFLTPSGERLFPTQDSGLFGDVVAFLVKSGYPGLVDDFFRKMWTDRREKLEEMLASAGAVDLEERLEVIEAFLEEEGFLPEITVDDNEVTIRECNCPFSEAVRATRLPCRLEAEFLEDALGRQLVRAGYMPEGHSACVYRFDPAAEQPQSDEE